MSAAEIARGHETCRMAHVMQPDVIEAGMRNAARMGGRFVCRDCGKPFSLAVRTILEGNDHE